MLKFVNKEEYKTEKDKYNYIRNHYLYYVMNSGNGLYTIANCVKVHKILEHKEYSKALDFMCNYSEVGEDITNMLYDMYILPFEEENKDIKVYCNGRSGGYLILCNKNDNRNVITNYDIYEEKEYDELTADDKDLLFIDKDFELIVDFDNMCNDMCIELKHILNNYNVRTDVVDKVIKVNRYSLVDNEGNEG